MNRIISSSLTMGNKVAYKTQETQISELFHSGKRKLLVISLLFIFAAISNLSIVSLAANSSQSISMSDLAATEIKLLQKTYENDPLPKRLQRLELLTFGATQYGSNLARWHNIEHYLQKAHSIKRDSLSVNSNKSRSISTSLNELEKHVFKKNTPAENTTRRLDKLETKLFGKASTNMPAEQRVARLERTLGLSSTPEQMAQTPYNFAPNSISPFNTTPFGHPMTPGMPIPFGFNGDDLSDPDLSQFESQMSQLFGQMQRQMQEQQGRAMPNPNQMPYYGAPHMMPQPKTLPGDKVPAYNDPNFI